MDGTRRGQCALDRDAPLEVRRASASRAAPNASPTGLPRQHVRAARGPFEAGSPISTRSALLRLVLREPGISPVTTGSARLERAPAVKRCARSMPQGIGSAFRAGSLRRLYGRRMARGVDMVLIQRAVLSVHPSVPRRSAPRCPALATALSAETGRDRTRDGNHDQELALAARSSYRVNGRLTHRGGTRDTPPATRAGSMRPASRGHR